MERKEFKQRVLEDQIFNELKDGVLRSSEYLRKKYQGTDVNFTRLYRRIINYQIKTYGTSLNDSNDYMHTKQEKYILSQRAKQRKIYRKNFIKKMEQE